MYLKQIQNLLDDYHQEILLLSWKQVLKSAYVESNGESIKAQTLKTTY